MSGLKLYGRYSDAANIMHLAAYVVQHMAMDSNCQFEPSLEQYGALAEAMRRMMKAGCLFQRADLEMLAAGEDQEMRDRFSKYDGFDEAHKVLNEIFDWAGVE